MFYVAFLWNIFQMAKVEQAFDIGKILQRLLLYLNGFMEEKDYIVRFMQGECSKEEQELVLSEAARNPEFKKMLIELKNIYVHENMPDREASEAEYASFKEYAMQRMLLEEDEMATERHLEREANEGKSRRHFFKTLSRVASWSAAAIVIILLALNLRYHYLEFHDDKEVVAEVLTSSLPIESVNTLYTAKGVKGETILPDGSKVILNSDSRITYPAKFTGSTRDIEFSGEGYFEVQKDSLHPMVVRCNKNFRVIVYGTTFNIKTYNNDNNAKTTLISGSIKIVENVDGKEFVRDIAPNQTYTIEESRQLATLEQKVDTEKVCEWKDGILSFDSTPFSEVVKILERWHGLQIIVKDNSKLNIPITARFTTESIVQIMDLLKFSTGIGYSISDNIVTVK